MGRNIKSDQRGIAALAIVGVIVLVVAVAGVGYMVYKNNSKNKDASVSKTEIATANAELEKTCLSLYDDTELCKFAGTYDPTKSSYKATFKSTGVDGKTTTLFIEADKNGNSSSVSKDGETETGAYITLNGDSYIKDVSDGTWTKYPKSPETQSSSNPTEDIAVDFKDEESKPAEQRISYKRIGKEACGNATCIKYQVVDPAQPTVESFMWISTDDYTMRKYTSKEADGSYSEGTFEYTSVNITAPSPVKDAPATPTEADLQAQIQAAQEAANAEQ